MALEFGPAAKALVRGYDLVKRILSFFMPQVEVRVVGKFRGGNPGPKAMFELQFFKIRDSPEVISLKLKESEVSSSRWLNKDWIPLEPEHVQNNRLKLTNDDPDYRLRLWASIDQIPDPTTYTVRRVRLRNHRSKPIGTVTKDLPQK